MQNEICKALTLALATMICAFGVSIPFCILGGLFYGIFTVFCTSSSHTTASTTTKSTTNGIRINTSAQVHTQTQAV